MNHLTDQQISELLMEIAPSKAEAHARDCAHCATRVTQLSAPLANFRGAVRNWSAAQRSPQPVFTISYGAPKLAGVYSLLIHATFAATLLALGTLKPVGDMVQRQISGSIILQPYISVHKVASGGGGGGGAREINQASKGALPKPAPRQFTPPRVDPLTNPKLPVPAAIVAPDDLPNVIANNFGDPLSKLGLPSDGAGAGAGIGPGTGGGVGSGNGAGFGSGDDGGFGGGIHKIGGGVSAPVVIFKPEPEYSEEARKAKWQGEVGLQVIVDANGVPVSVRVIRSLGLGLDEKAVEAVSKWRFKPAMKDGKPVAVSANVVVNFRLL